MRTAPHLPTTRAVFAALASLLLLGFSAGAQAQLPDFVSLVKQNKNAVVNITTEASIDREQSQFDIPEDHPFYDFFRRFGPPGGAPRGMPRPDERRAQGQGSGFIISQDGIVLTNAHVVDGADEITVRLSDQREYSAELIGQDDRSDVAVLKIEADSLPTLTLGDSSSLEVGEWVLAIGSPFGLDYTATQGIVSALGRSLPSDSYVPFIQTDVAVNPGNSGGPLLNTRGQVIGINSQIYSRSGGYQGVSFAIPIETAVQVADQLRDKGYVSRGWLGVTIQNVTQDLAKSFGMEVPKGALVANVLADSPADKAKIETGDIILKFDGKSVLNSASLPPIVGATPVGKKVKVEILRDGKRKTLTAKLDELTDDVIAASRNQPGPGEAGTGKLGVNVMELDDEQRERLGLEEGGVVVTRVEPGSPAARSEIRRGDVILRLGRTNISAPSDLREAVEAAPRDRPISMLIQREQQSSFVAVTIPE